MILSLDMIRPPPAVLVSPLLVSRCLPLSCQSSRLLCVLALTGIDGRVGPKEYITLQSAENCSKYAAELSSEERLKRRREAMQWNGRAPLKVDPQLEKPKDLFDVDRYKEGLRAGAGFTYYAAYLPATKEEIRLRLMDDELMPTLTFGEYGYIYLPYVSSIMKGDNNRGIRDLTFTLVYGPHDFVFEASTRALFDFWVMGIQVLCADFKRPPTLALYLRREWKKLVGEQVTKISYTQVEALLVAMMPKFDARDIRLKDVFNDHSADGTTITFDDLLILLRKIRGYQSMTNLFHSYASNGVLTAPQLLQFLHREQKETYLELEDAKDIINTLTVSPDASNPTMTWDVFCEYLSDERLNTAFNHAEHGFVWQDMSRPLTDYYIESSHNTYCTGDQLTSKSSVEMYAKVLREGCRCVELDCWNGDGGDPVILHGRTLTSRIKLRHVLMAIRDNAFVTSKYPVVLSLENHCTTRQQMVQAELIDSILGKLMLRPGSSDVDVFKSPEELEYKILLKGPVVADYYDSDDNPIAKKHKPAKVVKELCALTYIRATRLTGEIWTASRKPQEMSSFVEDRISKLYKHNAAETVQYTNQQFARVYPKGTRVDSSNYDPIDAWNLGCQMVALTSSEPMWINTAKFDDNGGCGIVLKPPIMTETQRFDPVTNPTFYAQKNPNSPIRKLTIKILGGRFLPKPPKNKSSVKKAKKFIVKKKSYQPFVSAKVYGLACDTREFKGKSTDGQNQLTAPDWGDTFSFQLSVSEMALLLIRVDISEKMSTTRIGNYCIPVNCIQEGYRVCKLYDYKGRKQPFADLLVHFTLERQ